MAKVKYSALVSDVRNKLNGSVLSKNRYGNYIRNKTNPDNPQTVFQQNQRSRFSSISSGWRDLTIEERDTWLAGAENYPFVDIFGDQKFLSGQALFNKLNNNLEKINQPRIVDLPAPVSIPGLRLDSVNVNLGLDGSSIDSIVANVRPEDIPTGFRAVVFATPPLPAGISFVKPRFRFLTPITSSSGGEINFTSAYTSRFGGNAPENTRIWVRIALVSMTTGQQSVPVQSVATYIPAD